MEHHRRSIRLKDYDYTQAGGYFVTLVTKNRAMLFGSIENDVMQISSIGKIVQDSWLWLAEQYPYVELGEFCVMPDHFHGILFMMGQANANAKAAVNAVGAVREPPLRNDVNPDDNGEPVQRIKPLGGLIGAFKTVSTKQINQLRSTLSGIVW